MSWYVNRIFTEFGDYGYKETEAKEGEVICFRLPATEG